MKTNEQLQNDVQVAIKSALLLNEAVIGVIAQDGVVTLTGVVDSDLKKIEAEEAAKNVSGVKAVIERLKLSVVLTGLRGRMRKLPGTQSR